MIVEIRQLENWQTFVCGWLLVSKIASCSPVSSVVVLGSTAIFRKSFPQTRIFLAVWLNDWLFL